MTTATYPFDAAELLDTPEAQAAYLSEAMDAGDPGEVRRALGVVTRARGISAVAGRAGITREGLHKAVGEEGDPKLTTLLGVLKALDLKLAVHPIAAVAE